MSLRKRYEDQIKGLKATQASTVCVDHGLIQQLIGKDEANTLCLAKAGFGEYKTRQKQAAALTIKGPTTHSSGIAEYKRKELLEILEYVGPPEEEATEDSSVPASVKRLEEKLGKSLSNSSPVQSSFLYHSNEDDDE
jgi:hypothetical protein